MLVGRPNGRLEYRTCFADSPRCYIKVRGADFGKRGAKNFNARVASATGGGTIELHLDGTDGPLAGTLPVPNTGGASKWQMESATVKVPEGTHDLYFVFKGPHSQELLNFDYWLFR